MVYKNLNLNNILENFFNNAFEAFDDGMKYPPHNVYKNKDGKYVIEYALAGFSKDDITIKEENGYLQVSSADKNTFGRESSENKYLVKKIALRNFQHTFPLGKLLKVEEAKFENGLLTIVLNKVETDAGKLIEIQ